MDKIKITRSMLSRGIQGRIRIHELNKFNNEMDIDQDFEKVKIIKKPKKVRTHGGFI